MHAKRSQNVAFVGILDQRLCLLVIVGYVSQSRFTIASFTGTHVGTKNSAFYTAIKRRTQINQYLFICIYTSSTIDTLILMMKTPPCSIMQHVCCKLLEYMLLKHDCAKRLYSAYSILGILLATYYIITIRFYR